METAKFKHGNRPCSPRRPIRRFNYAFPSEQRSTAMAVAQKLLAASKVEIRMSESISAGQANDVAAFSPLRLAWWCNQERQVALSARTAARIERVWQLGRRIGGGRMMQNVWLRYGMLLRKSLLQNVNRRLLSGSARVELMTAATLAELTASHPASNQIATANNLWNHGLRRAYLVRDAAGEVAAFVWVLTSADNERLRTLPRWGGLYTPIPDGWLQLENAFSMGRSLGRGQLLADLACRACLWTNAEAAGVLAHVGEHNLTIRRWLESLGCRRYGKIVRMQLDLPWLRRYAGHVHTVEPITVSAAVPTEQDGVLQHWIQRPPREAKQPALLR
jgi:hypothetical protein